MMKQKNIERSIFRFCTIAIFTAITLSFSSCEKIEEDTQAPKIVLIQPNEGQAFSVGTDFLVVTVMHDYVSLDRYRYTVNWFDDVSNVSVNPSDPAFELDQSGTILTNDSAPHWEDVNFNISIPNGIRQGYYILDIYCFDKAGNFDRASLKLLFQN
jgi:hypothetical protein